MENEIKNMRLIQIYSKLFCKFVEQVPRNEFDPSKQIYISDEDRLAIGKTKCFDLERNCVVDYDSTIDKIIEHKNELRARRQSICFPIINRGQLWYDTLSKSQKEELQVWYKAWLDVTETLTEPVKPEWLK